MAFEEQTLKDRFAAISEEVFVRYRLEGNGHPCSGKLGIYPPCGGGECWEVEP